MEQKSVGALVREWRGRRRLSQLDLALDAEISARHLSFIETGRAQPSREMVLRLAQHLAVPLRERNLLLRAAGFAPMFAQRPLDDPALSAAREAVALILAGHEPNPALAVDRHWTLIAANNTVPMLLKMVDCALLQPPVNVLRLSLHPRGLAPHILNYAEWRTHLLERLQSDIELTADAFLIELRKELVNYPQPAPSLRHQSEPMASRIAVPLRLGSAAGELSFWSATTVFGTAVEVTLSELTIESFFPADAQTAERMKQLHQA